MKSIFIDENYVSITKYDIAEWQDITLELREFIRSYIENRKDLDHIFIRGLNLKYAKLFNEIEYFEYIFHVCIIALHRLHVTL